MQYNYFNTIRTAPENLFLGTFHGQVNTWDATEIGPEIEVVQFGKGRKNIRTKNREALSGHPNIKCVITNDLDQKTLSVLETMPSLEQLHLTFGTLPDGLNLAGLNHCRMVVLNEIRKLDDLSLLSGMHALKSLFVKGPKQLNTSALSSLDLEELALWCFLDENQLSPLFEQANLAYLCLGGVKPLPSELSGFKKLKNLESMEINSSSHPFEFYARLGHILAKDVARNWSLLVRLRQNCPEHPGLSMLQASGIRQRPFCELCSPNKLKKLSETYNKMTNMELKVPAIDNEKFGFSKEDLSFKYFS